MNKDKGGAIPPAGTMFRFFKIFNRRKCKRNRPEMNVSIEDIIEFAKKVLEARGYRVTQVVEAQEADAAVDAALQQANKEHEDVAAADLSEVEAIQALKDAANAYSKE